MGGLAAQGSAAIFSRRDISSLVTSFCPHSVRVFFLSLSLDIMQFLYNLLPFVLIGMINSCIAVFIFNGYVSSML